MIPNNQKKSVKNVTHHVIRARIPPIVLHVHHHQTKQSTLTTVNVYMLTTKQHQMFVSLVTIHASNVRHPPHIVSNAIVILTVT